MKQKSLTKLSTGLSSRKLKKLQEIKEKAKDCETKRKKYANDPQFREAVKLRSRERYYRMKEKYANDPDFRAAAKLRRRERYHRMKENYSKIKQTLYLLSVFYVNH